MIFKKNILIPIILSLIFFGCGVKNAPIAPEDVKKESKEKASTIQEEQKEIIKDK